MATPKEKSYNEVLGTNRVEFDDATKKILIVGHFPPYVCGILTALESVIRYQNTKRNEKDNVRWLVTSLKNLDYDPNLVSTWQFKYKKDYENHKQIIRDAFATYERDNAHLYWHWKVDEKED